MYKYNIRDKVRVKSTGKEGKIRTISARLINASYHVTYEVGLSEPNWSQDHYYPVAEYLGKTESLHTFKEAELELAGGDLVIKEGKFEYEDGMDHILDSLRYMLSSPTPKVISQPTAGDVSVSSTSLTKEYIEKVAKELADQQIQLNSQIFSMWDQLWPTVANEDYLKELMGLDKLDIIEYPSHLPRPKEVKCEHSWKTYDSGFTQKFDYCEHCDVKKD
jgi:hypothetical protein